MGNGHIAVALVVVFLVGAAAGKIITSQELQGQAVEHNCAAYDATTGEWGWKSEHSSK